MTRKEKLEFQTANKDKAIAFKEGFFYKVYNQGAFLLKEKKYKVQSNGKGEQKCVYIGFTEVVLEKLRKEYKIESQDNYILIHPNITFDSDNYIKWIDINMKEIKNNKQIHFSDEIPEPHLANQSFLNSPREPKTQGF